MAGTGISNETIAGASEIKGYYSRLISDAARDAKLLETPCLPNSRREIKTNERGRGGDLYRHRRPRCRSASRSALGTRVRGIAADCSVSKSKLARGMLNVGCRSRVGYLVHGLANDKSTVASAAEKLKQTRTRCTKHA